MLRVAGRAAGRVGGRHRVVGCGGHGRGGSTHDTRAGVQAQARRKGRAHTVRGHRSAAAGGAVRRDRRPLDVDRRGGSVAECRGRLGSDNTSRAATTPAEEKEYCGQNETKPFARSHRKFLFNCHRLHDMARCFATGHVGTVFFTRLFGRMTPWVPLPLNQSRF